MMEYDLKFSSLAAESVSERKPVFEIYDKKYARTNHSRSFQKRIAACFWSKYCPLEHSSNINGIRFA